MLNHLQLFLLYIAGTMFLVDKTSPKI